MADSYALICAGKSDFPGLHVARPDCGQASSDMKAYPRLLYRGQASSFWTSRRLKRSGTLQS